MQRSVRKGACGAPNVARKVVCRVARPTQSAPEPVVGNSAGLLAAAGLLAPFALDIENAMAQSGSFGIMEGRTFSMMHPIVEGGLFVATLYAGYLGWQWRRARTIGEEIKVLKAKQPKVAVAAGSAPADPPAPTELDNQIAALEKVRSRYQNLRMCRKCGTGLLDGAARRTGLRWH